ITVSGADVTGTTVTVRNLPALSRANGGPATARVINPDRQPSNAVEVTNVPDGQPPQAGGGAAVEVASYWPHKGRPDQPIRLQVFGDTVARLTGVVLIDEAGNTARESARAAD